MYLEARVNCPRDRLLQPSRPDSWNLRPATHHPTAATNSGEGIWAVTHYVRSLLIEKGWEGLRHIPVVR